MASIAAYIGKLVPRHRRERRVNLYPDEDIEASGAPSDWTMTIVAQGEGEGSSYFADIQRAGKHFCRLVITGPRSEEEARRLLAVKARLWIDEYLRRPHTGTTGFGSRA